jgi:exodeoxyribonuclease VIII
MTDIKTCQDASPEAFARSAASYLYHVQAAHYFSAAEHIRGETPRFWAFICVESEPPHSVACYVLPGAAVLAGTQLMSKALERYAAALAAGKWPGYPETIDTLPFPKWALKFDI